MHVYSCVFMCTSECCLNPIVLTGEKATDTLILHILVYITTCININLNVIMPCRLDAIINVVRSVDWLVRGKSSAMKSPL